LAAESSIANTNAEQVVYFKYMMTAGTTSATTFKIRCGPDVGATITLNGSASARKFGGVAASRITIKEYLP
jgi:ribosomal protein L5